MTQKEFVYDSLDWGLGTIELSEKTLSGRKLQYCLQALDSVGGKVLEVGCARGQFIRSIKKCRPDLDAFGCDINDRAIEKNNLENLDDVNYVVGNAYQLPFPDESVDAVVMFDLLEHLDSPQKFTFEVFRVLKKGGTFHGYIPCEGQPATIHWLLWKVRCFHELKKKHRGHIQRFSNKSCVKIIEDSGFSIKNIQHSGYLIEQLLDMLFYIFLDTNLASRAVWDVHSKKVDIAKDRRSSAEVSVLTFFRDFAFALGYWEGKLLSFIPFSLGLHVTFRKQA